MNLPAPTPTPLPRRLEGRVCVVTGAARGIGLSIAERLGAEGALVAAWDVSEHRLLPAVAELCAQGLKVRGFACDVSNRSAVAATMQQVQQAFGAPVSVLVNNAVWARFQPLAEVDEEMVDRTLAVGFKALLWTLQAAVPQMLQAGGGAVINLSSVGAQYYQANSMVYGAMKAGVIGLTRGAAVELSPQRIRVNAVLPGMIGTEASKAQFDTATLAEREAAMPLGRFGAPQDIAAAVAYLASDDARYVQGATLVVDGGWTIERK